MSVWGNVPAWVSAVSGVGTLTIAGLAANYARGQLTLARLLREEKARPFVIVDFEPSPGPGRPFMDLVIRNVGETLARDVRFVFEPALASTLDGTRSNERGIVLSEAVILKDGIPSLPPGLEYRLLFDQMLDRYASDLPRRYTVSVSMSSTRRSEDALEQVLDLDIYYGYMKVDEHNVHHIAKTLRAWAKKSGVSSF